MKPNYKKYVKDLFFIILLVLYILNSNLVINSILEYTELFIKKLFPTTFIIYIIANILIDHDIISLLSIIFKDKGSTIYIILISLIGGFPSGAKYTKDLLDKNYITKDTANYLIRFTHFSNPLFILGSLSSLFTNNLNYLIYLSLVLSNFIIAFIYFKDFKGKNISLKTETSFSKSLTNAINTSIKILIKIYGTSIFFYLICNIITNYFSFNTLSYVIINGIFDLTKGSFSTSLITNVNIKSILIIIFNAMGSIPIHIQTKSIINDSEIKYKNYFLSRIMQTIFAIIIFLLIKVHMELLY